MAYGYLKRMANKFEDLKNELETYLSENMVFEAFILLIRETDIPMYELDYEMNREFELKNSRLSESEFISLQYELFDYSEYHKDI